MAREKKQAAAEKPHLYSGSSLVVVCCEVGELLSLVARAHGNPVTGKILEYVEVFLKLPARATSL